MRSYQSEIESYGQRPILIAYALMATSLFSLFIGPLAAYVIARIKAGDERTETWLVSHCKNLIEVFWFGNVLPALLSGWVYFSLFYKVFLSDEAISMGWQSVALLVITTALLVGLSLWTVYRLAKGIAAFYDRERV